MLRSAPEVCLSRRTASGSNCRSILVRDGRIKYREDVVDGLDVPIIPVYLDRVWGSVFSFKGRRIASIADYPSMEAAQSAMARG
jgi:hypothetical protein